MWGTMEYSCLWTGQINAPPKNWHPHFSLFDPEKIENRVRYWTFYFYFLVEGRKLVIVVAVLAQPPTVMSGVFVCSGVPEIHWRVAIEQLLVLLPWTAWWKKQCSHIFCIHLFFSSTFFRIKTYLIGAWFEVPKVENDATQPEAGFGWVLKWRFGSIHFQGKILCWQNRDIVLVTMTLMIFRDECPGTLIPFLQDWDCHGRGKMHRVWNLLGPARPWVPRVLGFGAGCSAFFSIKLLIKLSMWTLMIVEYLNTWTLEIIKTIGFHFFLSIASDFGYATWIYIARGTINSCHSWCPFHTKMFFSTKTSNWESWAVMLVASATEIHLFE